MYQPSAKTEILDSSKLKEFADNNFYVDENRRTSDGLKIL